MFHASSTFSRDASLSSMSLASFFSISNIILSLALPRFGWINTVADYLLMLAWCLLAVVNWISQSISAMPLVSFLKGSVSAVMILVESFFQKVAICFLWSSLACT